MALELPGYGRSSGKTFVTKPWAAQDMQLLLRALGTLVDDPKDLKVGRLPITGLVVTIPTSTCSFSIQGRVSVFAEGLGSAAFLRTYSQVGTCHLQRSRYIFFLRVR